MTSRLEKALKQLPPEAVEQVADYAESLARKQPKSPAADRHLTLDWIGIAKGARTGEDSVEIQHRILREWPGG